MTKLIKEKHYTREEIKFLLNNYQTNTNKNLAKKLNRTATSIAYKLSSMGCKRIYTPKKCKNKNCNRLTNEKGSGLGYCAMHWLEQYRKTAKGKRVHKKSVKKYTGTDRSLFSCYKHDANRRNRNYDFELTFEEFSKLINSNCTYCDKENCRGVDRVDNLKGYLLDNCTPCCGICNKMKSTLTLEEFKNHIEKISTNFNKC